MQEQPTKGGAMKKLEIYNAVIEVTRRCNMSCAHCLRGDAETIDISDEYLDKFFSKVSFISTLTLTGGEPSLVPGRIRAVIRSIKKHKVDVGTFYLVTNGKMVSDDFLLALVELYVACSDPGSFEEGIGGVAWSSDPFHDDVSKANIQKLRVLSFAHPREDSGRHVISEGRGTAISNGRALDVEQFELEDGQVLEGDVYLNCDGNIIAGCDWSYESQRAPEHIVCSVSKLSMAALARYNKRSGMRKAA